MRVHLDYGSDGLDVDVPDDRTEIVTPRHEPPVADPGAALRAALAAPIGRPPLGDARRAPATAWPSRCATSPGPSRGR